MSDVTLSKAVRSNLLHLQNTARMMDLTQERLATGKKVNSALDSPTNFFTASALNARASDIGTLLDAMSNGIRTIEAADNGLTAITKSLESMQSTLRQARQDKSFQTGSYTMAPNRTGEITFNGGVLGLDQSIGVALTNATPASVTAGADYAILGQQGQATFAFDAADFADPTDTLEFGLTINGETRPVVITKAIADSVAPDGDLDTAERMAAALEQAILAAGFGAAKFSVETDGTDITIVSDIRGGASNVAITGPVATGLGASDIATNMGAADETPVPAETSAFTIEYGGQTIDVVLNGNDHPRVADAVAAINAEIQAHNSGLPVADRVNVTASAEGNRVVLKGPSDGTGPGINVVDTVPASGDTARVFGSSAQRVIVAPSLADGPPKTVDQLVAEINARFLPDGVTPNPLRDAVRASNDNGKLRIENLSTQELFIDGIDTLGNVTGTPAANPEARALIDGNTVRANLAKQFNELRIQLDRLAEDASYNGINLLRGDQLKIVFNESGTSTIEIEARGSNGEARPINTSTLNLLNLDPADLDLDADIDKLLADLQVSLNTVRAQSSDLGSTLSIVQNRENFTKNMINTLQTGAANLTLADTNEEAANLLALQTRQQLSQTALSMASQSDQAVLRLFG